MKLHGRIILTLQPDDLVKIFFFWTNKGVQTSLDLVKIEMLRKWTQKDSCINLLKERNVPFLSEIHNT